MPLPNPKKDEKRDEFVSRCMSDDGMGKEFPKDKQRVAVCYSIYKKAKDRKESNGSEDSPTWEEVEKQGFYDY